MSSLLVINGPNLNLLGAREPGVYGVLSLAEIEAQLVQQVQGTQFTLRQFQSNHEGGLIDRIHLARTEGVKGIIINPGAYTHTSIALRDALAAVNIPFVEVHLTNVFARESFRHHSCLSDIAMGVIVGFGPLGYRLAVAALMEHLMDSGGFDATIPRITPKR